MSLGDFAEEELDWDGLHRAVFELLADAGPLEMAQIVLELRDAGHDVPADAVLGLHEELLNDDAIFNLPDGRYCVVRPLVEGVWFAHWVTAEEAADGVLPVQPDFVALTLIGDLWDLPDGGHLSLDQRPWEHERIGLHHRMDDAPALLGPPGWLLGHAGDVVALRVSGGMAEVRYVDRDAVAASGADVVATRRSFDRAARWEGVASLHDVTVMLLVDEDSPYRSGPRCLEDLLVSARLRSHRERILWAELFPDVYDLAHARASFDMFEIRDRPRFDPTPQEIAALFRQPGPDAVDDP